MPKIADDNKSSVKSSKNSGVPVSQLAADIGVSVDRLLAQFKSANIDISGPDDIVSEEKKQKLLQALQQHHGVKAPSQDKIVLTRARTSKIKVADSQGAKKTISVQVKKKRTYVKRAPLEDGQTKPVHEDASEIETNLTSASVDTNRVEEQPAATEVTASVTQTEQTAATTATPAPAVESETDIAKKAALEKEKAAADISQKINLGGVISSSKIVDLINSFY